MTPLRMAVSCSQATCHQSGNPCQQLRPFCDESCSLISAVGIFCLGAGVSIVHGIHAIAQPATGTDLGWGLAVLVLSTFVEGYTLAVAVRAVMAGARAAGMRFWDFIKSGRDPVSVAIMAEDGAAVAGVIIAGVCTKLVQVTGSAVRFRLMRLCVMQRHAHVTRAMSCRVWRLLAAFAQLCICDLLEACALGTASEAQQCPLHSGAHVRLRTYPDQTNAWQFTLVR